MRFILEALVVLGLIALVGVFFFQQRTGQQDLDRESLVRDELRLLYERTSYHAALEFSETIDNNEYPTTEFPVQIDPAWFGGRQPGNVLADEGHPWIDVAPPGDMALHPPDPVLLREDQAGVWYNPNNGIFRARTPADAGDELTLARYNRINSTELAALPRDGDATRRPLAYVPGHAPGSALASRERSTTSVSIAGVPDPRVEAAAAGHDDSGLFAQVEFLHQPEGEKPAPRRPSLRTD